MEIGLKFMAFIALFSIAVLCFYAITAINAFTKLLNDTNKSLDKLVMDLDGLQKNANTTLANLNEMKTDISKALESMDELKDRVVVSLDNYDSTSNEIRALASTANDGTKKVFKSIEPLESLATNIYDKVAPPLNQTMTIVNAFTKAFKAFRTKL